MNEFGRSFGNGRGAALAGRVALCLAASAGLSACLAHRVAEVRVDPNSPIAPYVVEAARYNTGYPKFSDIPAKPKDAPPAAAFKTQVQGLETARADLDRNTAPNTWTLNGTEAFESRALTDAGPELTGAPSAADTEAYARSLRERATPPPSPEK